MLIDSSSNVVGVNAAAAAVFLMKRKEVKGQYWSGLDAHLNQFGWKKNWLELQQTGRLNYQTDVLTATDYLRPVKVELVKLNDSLALLVLTDLLTFHAGNDQLQFLSLHASAGYWHYNRVDKKFSLSEEGEKLLGTTITEGNTTSVIEHLSSVIIADDWTAASQALQRILAKTGNEEITLQVKTDRGPVSLLVSARSYGNDLHVTHVFGTVQPVAEYAIDATESSISDQLIRFSVEQSHDMIFWTKPDGDIRYVNQSVCQKLAYNREEFEKLNIKDLVDSESNFLGDFKSLRLEKSLTREYVLLNKDGGAIHVTAEMNYLRFGEDEYVCFFCRDITQLKKKSRRRELIEFTVENSHEMILWTRPDGKVHFANRTFLEKTGYSRDQVEEESILKLFSNTNEDRRARAWEDLRKQGVLELESELRLANGAIIPISCRLNYLNFGEQEFDCIYVRDMRFKKNRDRIIELSQVALDQAGDCLLWLNSDFKIRYLNQTLLDLVGGTEEEYLNQPLQLLFPRLRNDAIVPGQALDFKVASIKGESKNLEFTASIIEDDGESYYVMAGRDITARKQEEERLVAAYAEIAELKDQLEEENLNLKEGVYSKFSLSNIVTVSPKYRRTLEQVSQVAEVDTTVLIMGETGTGKELLAQAVHKMSDREDAAMVKVNCAALPENLIESELFGHEKGAFTGASSRKKGRFEMAHRGTIFLDEIGELPLDLQSKLLRVLQEGEFERLGGTETVQVDVRLIAATNRDLAKMVSEGRFREDLYYRLNVFPINNLPLRDRPEDIPVLVEHFVGKFAKKQGKQITKINKADLNKLKSYAFPGNIRELENLVERAVVLCKSETLSIQVDKSSVAAIKKTEQFLTFEEMQRQYIIDALKKTGGRITGPEGAGQLLDINDRTLMSKMKKLEIEKRDYIV